MLPVWVLIVPTVVLGLLRYLINILVHKLSYAVITDYQDKQHTRWVSERSEFQVFNLENFIS
jgi:hypothetical protein